MEKYFIVHNPRCSKSREALELLQSKKIEPEIIDYLNGALTRETLTKIIGALGIRPKEILRTKEEEFKSLNLNLDDDNKVIEAILAHPKILERPIVLNGKKAVVGRPPENVLSLIDSVGC